MYMVTALRSRFASKAFINGQEASVSILYFYPVSLDFRGSSKGGTWFDGLYGLGLSVPHVGQQNRCVVRSYTRIDLYEHLLQRRRDRNSGNISLCL